jgi:hypothetical protein
MACCSSITGRLRIDERCALFAREILGVKPVLNNSKIIQLIERTMTVAVAIVMLCNYIAGMAR